MLGANFHAHIAAIADYHVDAVRRLSPAIFLFDKIVGDFASGRFGMEMKRRVAGEKAPDVAVLHGSIDGKLFAFPPIEGEAEISGFEVELKISEAIAGKHEAVAESGFDALAAQAFDSELTTRQFRAHDPRRFWDDDDVIDGAGAIGKTPLLLRQIIGRDRGCLRTGGDMDLDLPEPR